MAAELEMAVALLGGGVLGGGGQGCQQAGAGYGQQQLGKRGHQTPHNMSCSTPTARL
jgi:hypothetical protein